MDLEDIVVIVVAVVQSPTRVRLFATPQTATRQSFLSFTIAQSLLKLMSIELVTSSRKERFIYSMSQPSSRLWVTADAK